MAVGTTLRDAVVALRDFAATTEQQYVGNRALLRARRRLFARPAGDWRAYDLAGMSAASSYRDRAGERLVVLGSIDETSQLVFEETGALVRLANDAIALDAGAAGRDDGRAGSRRALELAAEKVIVRAAFVRCLLDLYLRACDADLVNRVIARDPGAHAAAHASMRRGVDDFMAALAARRRHFSRRVEVVDYARSLRFPMLPVAFGRPTAREARSLDLDRRPAPAGHKLH